MFSDFGLLDSHTVEINWGDGSVTETESTRLEAGEFGFSFSHTYEDDDDEIPGTTQDDFDVTVRVTDFDGGVGEAVKVVTVHDIDRSFDH